jgi:hypothetical protein
VVWKICSRGVVKLIPWVNQRQWCFCFRLRWSKGNLSHLVSCRGFSWSAMDGYLQPSACCVKKETPLLHYNLSQENKSLAMVSSVVLWCSSLVSVEKELDVIAFFILISESIVQNKRTY